nr:tRNA (adenine(22)-N(1))-methyltransferase TrmK [Candidatus Mycoplasma haemohominis]
MDIGSDHGHLGLELLRSEKAIRVINIDLSADALERSKVAYKRLGFEKRAMFLLNDGFTSLVSFPENSVVVIAGMGTVQILKILERMPSHIKHLILLSHTDYFLIRKWAFKNFFFIKNEKYVDDGDHCYLALDLVRVPKQVHSSSIRDYIFGREEFWRELHMDLFSKYWADKANRVLKIPYEYRDEVERETIRFLKDNEIL